MNWLKLRPASVIGGVLGLVFIAAASLVAISIGGNISENKIIISALTGIVSPAILAFLAVLKGDNISDKLDDVGKQLNGGLDNRIRQVVKQESKKAIEEETTNDETNVSQNGE